MITKKAEALIQHLRDDYDLPIAAGGQPKMPRDRCLGGIYLDGRRTLLMRIRDWWHSRKPSTFPSPRDIANGLCADNSWLKHEQAVDISCWLIALNDAKYFDAAWDVLTHALTWNPVTQGGDAGFNKQMCEIVTAFKKMITDKFTAETTAAVIKNGWVDEEVHEDKLVGV